MQCSKNTCVKTQVVKSDDSWIPEALQYVDGMYCDSVILFECYPCPLFIRFYRYIFKTFHIYSSGVRSIGTKFILFQVC